MRVDFRGWGGHHILLGYPCRGMFYLSCPACLRRPTVWVSNLLRRLRSCMWAILLVASIFMTRAPLGIHTVTTYGCRTILHRDQNGFQLEDNIIIIIHTKNNIINNNATCSDACLGSFLAASYSVYSSCRSLKRCADSSLTGSISFCSPKKVQQSCRRVSEITHPMPV